MQYIVRTIDDFISLGIPAKEYKTLIRHVPYKNIQYTIQIIDSNNPEKTAILEPSILYDTHQDAIKGLENLALQLSIKLGYNITVDDKKYYPTRKNTTADQKLVGYHKI
ncbi:MAG: hypothetical protein ACMXYG_03945 [Candidatus Woesearchaeota archaeon]